MTLADWVASEYNTDNYAISNGELVNANGDVVNLFIQRNGSTDITTQPFITAINELSSSLGIENGNLMDIIDYITVNSYSVGKFGIGTNYSIWKMIEYMPFNNYY